MVLEFSDVNLMRSLRLLCKLQPSFQAMSRVWRALFLLAAMLSLPVVGARADGKASKIESQHNQPLNVKINFQPLSAVTPEGFLPDHGDAFGVREQGYVYGWNRDNRPHARERIKNDSPGVIFNTLNHMQKNGDYAWEIEAAPQEYRVRVVAGDPAFTDSVIRIEVEGVVVVEGIPTLEEPWVEGNAFVMVSDGRLTVNSAAGAVNNKINFIEIATIGLAQEEAPIYRINLPIILQP